ncbi:MAG: hypothetical protein ACRDZO_11485, partial [Egibacteraceae bacterium]
MSVTPSRRGTADPEQMRQAMAAYVTEVHRAYVAHAHLLPPAARGRMPLLAGGRFEVAAVGARNLHIIATREPLGPVKGIEVELPCSLDGLEWTLRFYDPVVLPQLGLIDESTKPAQGEVCRALGVTTVLYHLIAQPGAGLSGHHALHVGTGLANAHVAAARDFEAIRRHA